MVVVCYAGLAVWLSLLAVYLSDPVVPGVLSGASYLLSGLVVRGSLPRRALPLSLLLLAAGSLTIRWGWPSWLLFGIGLGCLRPAMVALSQTVVGSQERAGALYNLGLNLGWCVGGLGGDLLRTLYGWGVLFNLVTTLFAVACGISFVLTAPQGEPLQVPARVGRPSAFAWVLLSIVVLYTALSAQTTGVAPLLLEQAGGPIRAGAFAAFHAALVAFGSTIFVWRYRAMRRASLAAIGLLLAGGSFLIVGLPRQAGHWHVIAFVGVFALAETVLTPTVLSFAGALPSVQRVLFWTLHGVGFLGGALLSLGWHRLGTRAYFVALSALAAVGLGLIAAQWRNSAWDQVKP